MLSFCLRSIETWHRTLGILESGLKMTGKFQRPSLTAQIKVTQTIRQQMPQSKQTLNKEINQLTNKQKQKQKEIKGGQYKLYCIVLI